MQMKMDSVKSNRYYDHWNRTRDIDEQIFNAKKKIKVIESVDGIYKMKVTIMDETTSPSYTRINFVHMPGAEYTYLMLENPKVNLSHAVYQGVNIKYLFTKGKSFFELGAFKAAKNDIKKDSLAFSELFVLDFGQDFYSRYFGRGSNKFMNLYVGYKTGLALASTDTKLQVLPTISPSLGVELFKNKYVLLDVKASYFLPLIENRHMRGLGISGAFNFVF
jgi:sucrose-6-phosphate hydrolase SacC (GH32 family)